MTLVIFNKNAYSIRTFESILKQTVKGDSQMSYQSEKYVSNIIVYKLSQQKRFCVDVRLKSSMA